jgi:predicted MFS family arabinose efflux permease
MSETPSAGTPPATIDYRLLAPLLLNTVTVQVAVSIIRVTTSYRAIELDLSVVWLGVISAAFAVLPLIFAVSVGRFIDRGNDALAAWIGGALLVVTALGFVLWSSPVGLIACTAMLGVSQMFLIAGQQIVCLRSAPVRFEEAFGHYMVANAIGQGLGPYLVGWIGGGATVPPTGLLFTVGLAIAVLALAFALAIRREPTETRQAAVGGLIPVIDLLRVPGLKAMVLLGVISVTSQDLLIVYLPLLGTERHIDVADIGVLLTVRAVASMVSRFLYARIVIATGRHVLTIASSAAGAAAFLALAIPLPLWTMSAATAIIGFAIGLTTTLSITGLVTLVAPGARATANSLRMVGNRIGQLVFPFGGGLVAAAAGVGGIFVILAVGLAASAAAQWRRPVRPRPPV